MGSKSKANGATTELIGFLAAAAVFVWGGLTFFPGEFLLFVGPVLRRFLVLGFFWGGVYLMGRRRA